MEGQPADRDRGSECVCVLGGRMLGRRWHFLPSGALHTAHAGGMVHVSMYNDDTSRGWCCASVTGGQGSDIICSIRSLYYGRQEAGE